jgi:hypothetical protein
MANDDNVALLKKCVDVWNEWRNETPISVRISAGRTSAERTSNHDAFC